MMPEKSTICDKLHLSRTHSESFLRTFRISRANSLNLPNELTEPFLRTHRTFSVDELKCRALNVNTASLRHRNAERSPSR